MTTILICDDHRIVREGLKQFVQSVPGVVRVETAASGEEVLARYDLERPDLVLMDVQMPGLGRSRDHPTSGTRPSHRPGHHADRRGRS